MKHRALSASEYDPNPAARSVIAIVGMLVFGVAAVLAAIGGLALPAGLLGLVATIAAVDMFVLSPDSRRRSRPTELV